MKSSLSESDLEALVLKMKQINKDIDEVSDDQMRQMISQSLASKPSGDENEKFSEGTNKEDMSQMNIMKPADRLIDPRTQTNDSAAKGEPLFPSLCSKIMCEVESQEVSAWG